MTTASDPTSGTVPRRTAAPWDRGADGSGQAGYVFKARYRFLRDLCRADPPAVLDAGCGTGGDLLALAPHIRVGVGVDLDGARVAEARAAAAVEPRGNLRFAIGDAVAFTLADAATPPFYDLILLADVLEQVADPRRILAACRRRLAIGGRIVVIAVHRSRPGRWLEPRHEAAGHHFTPAELRHVGRRAGLETVACRALPHLPPRPERGGSRAAHALLGLLARLPVPAFKGAFALVMQPALR